MLPTWKAADLLKRDKFEIVPQDRCSGHRSTPFAATSDALRRSSAQQESDGDVPKLHSVQTKTQSSQSQLRVDNQALASALAVMTDERFADHCRKEAGDCEREAERTVSPLDKEAWLRLSREWTKLAGPASPPRVNRRTLARNNCSTCQPRALRRRRTEKLRLSFPRPRRRPLYRRHHLYRLRHLRQVQSSKSSWCGSLSDQSHAPAVRSGGMEKAPHRCQCGAIALYVAS